MRTGHGRAALLGLSALLVVAGAWAYGNSFRGVFVLDDVRAIVENTTTTSFATALTPPPACTVAGRPVANLSLALNYTLAPPSVRDVFRAGVGPRSGTADDFLRNIAGYHLLNVVIHLCAGLLLFGCVRRTLTTARLAPTYGEAAPWLAFAVALIWLVHPLQTESVTYVVQRVESLMGLFYLMTLYCAIRAFEVRGPGSEVRSPRSAVPPPLASDRARATARIAEAEGEDGRSRRLWSAAAVLACALGMATKEVMVTAPIVVALWDRTFAPPDHRPRWRLLAGLAATWIVLALLVWNEHRAPSLDVGQSMAARYLFTQASILLHYLRLSVFAAPLVFFYTWPIVPSFGAVALPVLVVCCLAALTVIAVVRRWPIGFVGAWFFLILAPTSSVLPIVTEVAAEHRMYLPLAAVVCCAVVGAFAAGRALLRGRADHLTRYARVAGATAVIVLVVVLGVETRERNQTFWSETGLWEDTVAKQPGNQRARVLYGVALLDARRFADADVQLREAVRLEPGDPIALARLGMAEASEGNLDGAIATWEKAVAVLPSDYGSHRHLGEAYVRRQQEARAIEHLERALALDARDPSLILELATLLADAHDAALRNPARALELAERAAAMTGRQDPRALDVLSVAQAGMGRFKDAAATADEALVSARQQGSRPLIAELEYRSAAYRARDKH